MRSPFESSAASETVPLFAFVTTYVLPGTKTGI